MTARVTEKVHLPHVEKELKALLGMKVIVGPIADNDSHLAKRAAANEFGAVITPKSSTYLAIPVRPEAKGRSPRDFDLKPIFPKNGTPYLARIEGKRVVPFYILKKKVVIPERSYLRSTFDRKETQDKLMRILIDGIRRLIAGSMTADDVINALGASLAASVKSQISSNIGPPNSPLTTMLKNSRSTTLVDEGDLLKSISWEVL
jgi:hypothetical protein